MATSALPSFRAPVTPVRIDEPETASLTLGRRDRWALIAIFFVYVALAGSIPVSIVMWQGYDDALFIRLAHHIAEGRWLGPYDHLTLIKGPVYSIFLWLASLTRLPIYIVYAIGMFASSFYFSWIVARVAYAKSLLYGLLLVLLVSPAVYFNQNRILRDHFYIWESLLLFGLAIQIFYLSRDRRGRYGSTLALGLLLGAYWVTREESVWILPVFGVISLHGLFQPSELTWTARIRRVAAIYAIAGLSALAVPSAIGAVNYFVYGRFVVVEMKDPAFQRALVALQRVGATFDRPYVPVPKAARELIAQQSPTYRQIGTYFEGEYSQGFCDAMPQTCGDFAGGWYFWALRNAAAKAGMHDSPSHAASFYTRLAEEVEAACAEKRLPCIAWLPPIIPHISEGQWSRVPELLQRSVRLLIYHGNGWGFHRDASAFAPDGDMAVRLLNRPPTTDEQGNLHEPTVARWFLAVWEAICMAAIPVLRILTAVGAIAATIFLMPLPLNLRNPLWLITVAIITGLVVRLAALILVDISSFPVVYSSRLMLHYPLVGVVSLLCIYGLAQNVRAFVGWRD